MKDSTGKVLRISGFSVMLLMLVLLIPRCILFPNEGYEGDLVDNIRPSVLITGGVHGNEGNTESRVHFYWRGADTDGVIRYFEWAIDDTMSESAWTQTTTNDADISFLATTSPGGVDFDTTGVDLTEEENRFSDWHTFYVRSVDNDFSRSAPDKRFFNSLTIAPTSRIVNPAIVGNTPQWATTIRMGWEGEDLDGSRADKLPSWFEIKLIQVPPTIDTEDIAVVRAACRDSINLLLSHLSENDYPEGTDLYHQAKRAWIRKPSTDMEHLLRALDPGLGRYMFAVRAIDECGAVEPTFLGATNWVKFQVLDTPIDITIYEDNLGEREFSAAAWPDADDGSVWNVTVAPDQNIRFRWVGDASSSGTEPGSCNYAIDISDPTDETLQSTDGMYGWIGWAPRVRMQETISFPAATGDDQIHFFYLKMRDMSDDVATETKCMVRIKVADFSFSKKFLVVDDLGSAPVGGDRPRDDQSDEWRLVYNGNGYSGIFDHVDTYLSSVQRPDEFNAWGDDEGTQASLGDDFLEILGGYETVIWDFGAGSFGELGLLEAVVDNTFLSQYVGLGGNLMMYGEHGPVSYIREAGFGEDEPICPNEFLAGDVWNNGSFLWQKLHLTDCVRKAGMTTGLTREKSLVGCRAVNPLYPDLYLDLSPERWNRTDGVGIYNYEILYTQFPEEDASPWYLREDGMELLYRSDITGETEGLHNRPIAYRTSMTREDSLQGMTRGRIVSFGTHLYYFHVNAVHDAMSLALDWLVTGSEYTGIED